MQSNLLVAFLLGSVGSLSHCVGMCGGVLLLIQPRGEPGARISSWRMLPAHVGRITTYALLGFSVGLVGDAVALALPDLRRLQGTLSFFAALLAGYFALSLLGMAPSLERLLSRATSRWGQAMKDLRAHRQTLGFSFVAGTLWGLLPCGLVLTALLPAAASGSPLSGALTMLAFGLGTWPALLGLDWLTRRGRLTGGTRQWLRQASALLIVLFGAQMALRGLAAWGWIGHFHVGSMMIW